MIITSDTTSPEAPTSLADALAAPHASASADDLQPREAPAAFVERALAFDEARPSFAGEHALVFGAGLALLLLAISRAPLARALTAAAGAGLLVRSLSGRDGIRSLQADTARH